MLNYLQFILLPLAIVYSTQTHAAESLCKPEETVYFSCKIRHSDNLVSLCGSVLFGKQTSDSADEGKWLQYRFGKKAKPSFIFPSDRPESLAKFKGMYINNKLQEFLISFVIGEFSYNVESSYSFNGIQVLKLNQRRAVIDKKEFPCSGVPVTSDTSYGRSNMEELTIKLEQIASDTEQLHWVENADPILDAKRAVNRQDYTLFNLPHNEIVNATSVPGVESAVELAKGEQEYHPIVGADNTGVNAGHDRLLQRAIEYASKYNQFILLHKNEK